ncbi:Hypp7672 [Branchiostoma lanceolatum]|uniref:Hypp7672 protein n=1 Tax=Branchiostoma lanceolatum TaxID=7740 RepID=A0A8J9Z2X5_BRALA|nr:Hypp7672 [Branchiostoma lanceolatum]
MAITRNVGPVVVSSLVILLTVTVNGYHLGDTHVDNNIICISPAIKPPLGCMCNVTTSDNIVKTPTCDQSILEEVKNLLEALVVNTEISNSPSECLASSFYLDGRLVSCTDSIGLQLGDENNPAHSCRDIHIACRGYERGLQDGFYWIKTSENQAVQAFCDMTHGGWTMVGKIGGNVGDIHDNWLVANHNTRDLQYPRVVADDTYASMDARMLAVEHANEMLMSNGDNDHGFGSRWVKWQLPEWRTVGSLWDHSAQSSVSAEKLTPVVVTSWDGEKSVCYQNKYGVLPRPENGGAFPGVASDMTGTVDFSDRCVAVGVMEKGDMEGFDTNILHAPIARDGRRRHSNFVSVWLK